LEEYDFVQEHKSGQHNLVTEALSRREVLTRRFSIVMVESYMLDKLKQAIGEYAVYAKLIDLI
jgi:hypothetical protein